jgi:pilus assembly protein CpaE
MDIHLITQESALLNALVKTAEAASMPVSNAICRQPQQALAPLLEKLTQGALFLDSQALRDSSDWNALASLTRRSPRLNVVLLSNDAQQEHLLRAMRAGVREVLQSPPSTAELKATWQRFTDHRVEAGPSRAPVLAQAKMVAFVACKGGAGATFLSTSMAHMLAHEFRQPCTFIDMDFQYGDASFYLGSMAHPNTVADLAGQTERLDSSLFASCLYSAAPGLQVLAAPNDVGSALSIHARQMAEVLAMARTAKDWVLVDLPRSMDATSLKALDMADVVFMVLDSTIASLRNAKRLLQLFQSLGYSTEKLQFILNKDQQAHGVDHSSMETSLGVKIKHTVPTQFEQVNQCIAWGQPIGQLHPHSPVTHALRKITAQLLQVPPPEPQGWLSRWLSRTSFTKPLSATGAPLETRHS